RWPWPAGWRYRIRRSGGGWTAGGCGRDGTPRAAPSSGPTPPSWSASAGPAGPPGGGRAGRGRGRPGGGPGGGRGLPAPPPWRGEATTALSQPWRALWTRHRHQSPPEERDPLPHPVGLEPDDGDHL